MRPCFTHSKCTIKFHKLKNSVDIGIGQRARLDSCITAISCLINVIFKISEEKLDHSINVVINKYGHLFTICTKAVTDLFVK